MDMDSIVDVTKLYDNGEMEDEWSETMEELNIDNMLANYMESEFNLPTVNKHFQGAYKC